MKRLLCFVMAALMVLAVSCKKDPKGHDPSVKTMMATGIGARSAFLNAQFDFADARQVVSSYGFYLGTSEDSQDTYIPGDGPIDGNNAYSVKITDLAPETQYWYKAYAELDDKTLSGDVKSFRTDPIPERAVDLGIVMTRDDGTTYHLYWAECGIGRDGFLDSPKYYGNFYAWGETEIKSEYTWNTYAFGASASGPFSKYNTDDNKNVLDTGSDGDDVASKILGGKWRLPTDEEWAALLNNCTWEWTDTEFYPYASGGFFTSKIEGYKDRRIYLSAGGYKDGLGLHDDRIGHYWSSSLNMDNPGQAWYVDFNRDNVRRVSGDRCCGQSVRPVYED